MSPPWTPSARGSASRRAAFVISVARNSSSDRFCGSCCSGCRAGEKRGTHTTWLVDAVKDGAVVVSACKNKNKNNKEKRCVGLIATGSNGAITKKLRFKAKSPISACGALFEPPLMEASGFRNRHMIGKNLHRRRLCGATFRNPYPILKERSTKERDHHVAAQGEARSNRGDAGVGTCVVRHRTPVGVRAKP